MDLVFSASLAVISNDITFESTIKNKFHKADRQDHDLIT